RNCRDCKKELVGKYYLITGIPRNGYEASRANYCASCEVGDKIEDEISEFEDNSIQKARQELEPYLQKSEIVEKA
ncbi:26831_t:CDS:2, partial [Racocetra persica]